MHPNESEWSSFYAKVKQKSGLDLTQYKQDQLRRRTLNMFSAQNSKSLDDFWKAISSANVGINWYMDRLAINVSELYRNPEKWHEMQKSIIPMLLEQNKTLKCWSAGCSIGAEAHSLAMIFDSFHPGRHSILGTDIDLAALEQARSGTYSENELRAVPADLRTRYFSRTANSYVAKPELGKYLTFKTGNLLADRFQPGFDLIMCRNVVIYFNDDAKDNLYEKFFAALRPGGILFVGGTERIAKAKEIGFESKLTAFYQKPIIGEKTWRTAS